MSSYGAPKFACVRLQRSEQSVSSRCVFSLRSNWLPSYVQSNSVGFNLNKKKNPIGQINSLEKRISLAALI